MLSYICVKYSLYFLNFLFAVRLEAFQNKFQFLCMIQMYILSKQVTGIVLATIGGVILNDLDDYSTFIRKYSNV